MLGMGGDASEARACATDMVREWERHENFSLYEDALPVLEELRRHDVKIGLVSNGQRDLAEFAEHHGLVVDAIVGSKAHGRIKPHPSIFVAALTALGTRSRSSQIAESVLQLSFATFTTSALYSLVNFRRFLAMVTTLSIFARQVSTKSGQPHRASRRSACAAGRCLGGLGRPDEGP